MDYVKWINNVKRHTPHTTHRMRGSLLCVKMYIMIIFKQGIITERRMHTERLILTGIFGFRAVLCSIYMEKIFNEHLLLLLLLKNCTSGTMKNVFHRPTRVYLFCCIPNIINIVSIRIRSAP